ncbi:uncharacterized protein LOC109504406 isoform X1 [Harpegnathos saltator]|uniref:uncharacterized protein LOC109504406 isoform X1 n=1 Tax=Harpegnathos saltator TaxID=610380 RepID=UPI000DBEE926|nr:uncharacterized protein LOC109504406 isoform X1 [Harpegnathos saltator]XP_025160060.1 uncharacterized protein LOC109504406 isoform X1 [Harpegnathos saltator]
MVFAGQRYYDINQIMLTKIGLWPYQKPSILQTVFILSALILFILSQFAVFLTTECDFIDVINIFSYTLPCFVYLILYNCFYFNINEVSTICGFLHPRFSHFARISCFRKQKRSIIQRLSKRQIKQLLEQIKMDWNIVEYSEMQILEKYAVGSRIISLILVYVLIFSGTILITVETLPIILDIIAPMNVSRPRKIVVDLEIFLDQQQYFYVYLIYEIVPVLIGFLTVTAVGSLLLAFLTHSCAIYKIASNLIGNIVTKQTLEIPADQKAREMYRRITRAVFMQRKAIQFTKFLMNSVDKWFFVLMVVGVLSLSCNLLRFLITITMLKELSDAILCGGLVCCHFGMLFISNFIGQFVMDHSTEIFTAVCNITWYLAPLQIQKLLLFVMQYSLKANRIMLGGIFVASLEGFSSLTTTSISYFTVLYSTL